MSTFLIVVWGFSGLVFIFSGFVTIKNKIINFSWDEEGDIKSQLKEKEAFAV